MGADGWTVRGFSAQRSLEEAQVGHGDTCWEIWAEFAPGFVHKVRDGCSPEAMGCQIKQSSQAHPAALP